MVGRGTLPFPALGFGFIIQAMALPEGDMAAGEPFGPGVGRTDQGDGLSLGIGHPERSGHRFARIGHLRHRKGLKRDVLGRDVPEGIGPVRRWHQGPELVLDPVHIGGPQGIVPQFGAELEIQGRPPFGHLGQLQVTFDRSTPLQAGPQGVGGLLEFPDGLGLGRQGGKKNGRKEEELTHGYRCFRRSRIKTRRELMPRASRSARKSFGSPLR